MLLPLIAGIAGLLFALFGAIVVFWSLVQMRVWWTVRGTDWQDIIDIDGGQAKVTGEATRRDGTVTAPFTGRECLAVESAIRRHTSAGSRGPRWQDDHTSRKSVPFDVADQTGSITVDPSGADWWFDSDHEHQIPSAVAPKEPYAEFVETEDIYFFDDEGVAEAHELRFVERRIEPGEELHVFGPIEDGVERRVRARESRFGDAPFSIAEERSSLEQNVGTGMIGVLFGLVFMAGGLWFAWLGLL